MARPSVGVDNRSGQLGTGSLGGLSATPVAVTGGQSFIAISAGLSHTCAINSAGQVMCWGSNGLGQLGALPSTTATPFPTSVGSGPFSRITAGDNHTCAMTAGGAAVCWGWNKWGQAGNGGVVDFAAPGALSGGMAFRSISAGADHTCGIAADNETYCWGSNVFGALGNELQAAYRATPQKVAVPR